MIKYAAGIIAILLLCCKQPSGTVPGERVSYDPDLYGWRAASLSPFGRSDNITGFAYGKAGGEDRYVAVSSSGMIAWSANGDVWHGAAGNPFDASFNAVAFGDGVFIAGGGAGKIARSTDGVHWTAGVIDEFETTAGDIFGIAWGRGTFVAAGGKSTGAVTAVSGDRGVSWTGGTLSGFSSAINDIAYSGAEETFYLAGSGGQTGYSSNLSDWHHYRYGEGSGAKDDPGYPFFGNDIRKIIPGSYGGEPALGVVFAEWGGRRIAVSKASAFRNPEGHDWDADLFAGNFYSNELFGIAWGGGCFVAAGQGAMIGWWPADNPSVDRSWRALSLREFKSWQINTLAALNGRFFAGGYGGKIGYSK